MASKLGASCGYITRLAEDPFSDYLLREWSAQGIDASASKRVPGFTGVHFVTQLPGGDRDFLYYRTGSAASTMSPDDLDADYIGQARVLHVSGILQAVSESCRETVLEAVRIASARGVMVSYDTKPEAQPHVASAGQGGHDGGAALRGCGAPELPRRDDGADRPSMTRGTSCRSSRTWGWRMLR